MIRALSAFISNTQASQALQASNMIGHVVMTEGSTLSLTKGQSAFAINLPSTADTVKVTIKDSSGAAVKEMSLGRQVAGVLPLQWTGVDDAGNTLKDGQYSFEVKASIGGKAVAATSLSYAEVTSVSTSTSGAQLNLSNAKTIALDAVQQVF